MFRHIFAFFLCFCLIGGDFLNAYAQAISGADGEFNLNQLPVPGAVVGESTPFIPASLKGLLVNPSKPLEFEFIMDTGYLEDCFATLAMTQRYCDKSKAAKRSQQELNMMLKYFMAGLTISENDLWVNLSPFEKERIVPEVLGQTSLGRDLLAQDYILKQLTASMIDPNKNLGQEFWHRVYAKSQEKFGTTNIPVNTFNKVWILPDQAEVFENGNGAYITKSTLKVMLDEDYLALTKNRAGTGTGPYKEIMKEIIIPEIEKEVNGGKNFARLRQIYHALILAKWYKETVQNRILDALYTNKQKIAGVQNNDPLLKQKIYERYLQAYRKGVFNYIKENPMPDGKMIATKYFSGGLIWRMNLRHTRNPASIGKPDGAMMAVKIVFDKAMLSPVLERKAQELGDRSAHGLQVKDYRVKIRPLLRGRRLDIYDRLNSRKTREILPFLQEMDTKPRYTNSPDSILKHSLEIAAYIRMLGEGDIKKFNEGHAGWHMTEELADEYRKVYKKLTPRDKELLNICILGHDIAVLIQDALHPEMGAVTIVPILKKLGITKEDDIKLVSWFITHHTDLGTVYTSERSPLVLQKALEELPTQIIRRKARIFLAFHTIGELRTIQKGRFLQEENSRLYLQTVNESGLEKLKSRLYYNRIRRFSFNVDSILDQERLRRVKDLLRNKLPESERGQFVKTIGSTILIVDYGINFMRRLSPEAMLKFLYLISQIEKKHQDQLWRVDFTAPTYKTEGPAKTAEGILKLYSWEDLTLGSDRFDDALRDLRISEDLGQGNIHCDNKDLAMLPENGGIDLNQIMIHRTGRIIDVPLDPAGLKELIQGGFEGFVPVIISMKPIKAPFSPLEIH